jgi:hypothetical protein
MSLLEIATSIDSTSLSTTLKNISWIVPLVQCVHILMVGVVFVSILMICLRLLGKARIDEPLPQVWNRFAPFFWTGLALMIVTGTLLVIAEPVREFMTLSFRLKMIALAICIVSAAAFGHRMRGASSMMAGINAPLPAGLRVVAVSTLALWVAIIFLGRAIAYDDSVWGKWSPAVLQRGA